MDSPPADMPLTDLEVGSIVATVNVNDLDVGGSASNFAMSDTSTFVTLPDFGVSLDTNIDAGKLKWPGWLPIKVDALALRRPDSPAEPLAFSLRLSADVSVDKLPGRTVTLSGFVQDVVIDLRLLRQGQFPITGLGGIGIEAGGNVFGGKLRGGFFLSLLRLDATGHPLADTGTTTEVARLYLYGGIVGIDVVGYGGFEVRLGVSALGPFIGYIKVIAQVILDPLFIGLTLTGFRAGISFTTPCPTLPTRGGW